jgi:hypothetical protein
MSSSICEHVGNASDLFSLCLLLLLSDNLGCHFIETAEIRDVAELRFMAVRLLKMEYSKTLNPELRFISASLLRWKI